MNFFSGRIVEREQKLYFDEGSGVLPIASWASPELAGRVGAELVMGVRPEGMSDREHARFRTEDNCLPMQVTLVQPLGHKMDVYLSTPSHPRAVAQIDSSAAVRSGDSLPVFFDMERVHFFEPGDNGSKVVRNASTQG